MFESTIAGSLPRPDWLAEPEKLKGGWKLSGKELEEGKVLNKAKSFFKNVKDKAMGN